MLRPKSPQSSFFVSGNYLYDRIVPPDHLLRKINAVVDFSFVNELVRDRYTPDFGRPAEDPEFMLRLCLLQYIYGDSDRQVIENARMHNGYKYFLGMAVDDEPPDYSTVSYFRAIRLGEDKFRQVFQNIVQQCIDKGLVTGKRQMIDSTHIVADAARNSLSGLIKIGRRNVLKAVERQDARLAERLGSKDLQVIKQDRFTCVEEGLARELFEAEKLLDRVTVELKKKRLEVTPELQAHLDILEKAVADRADGATDRLISTVDTSARGGKKTGKSWTGYKGHMLVEEDSEIITAIETTPANKEDGSQLKPLLKQQEEANSLIPSELSGDKAYGSGANLEHLTSKDIIGNISLTQKINYRGSDLFTVDDFKYDEATDTVTCPAGCVTSHSKRDLVMTEDLRRNGIVFQFSRRQCSGCELKPRCFNSKSEIHGRGVHINYYHAYYDQMKARMESEQGKEAYRNRYRIEHKIADLARYCGMRRCRYRGLSRARIHTLLAATVSNVKRMARLLWETPVSPPQIRLVTC